MVKIHAPASQDALVEAAGALFSIIATDAHIKSAASCAMSRDMLDACRPDKDHFLMHVIAMGDHEHYGPNINCDAWPKAACVKHHPTFVSNGYFFREHKNSDPKLSIGLIKGSAYNKEQGRIELAVWGRLHPQPGMEKTAEEEYETAKAGKPLAFSMSAKVPHDRCSVCGNLAKSSSAYCSHMKDTPGKYLEEHEKFAFTFNDHPTFFDISKVRNPADRIARHLEYVFSKQASYKRPILGVELAEQEQALILDLTQGCNDQRKNDIMEKLAELEARIDASTSAEHSLTKWLPTSPELDDNTLRLFRELEPGTLFHKLAKAQVILPFTSFAAYCTGTTVAEASSEPSVKLAAAQLPGIFRALVKAPAATELETLCDPCSSASSNYDLAYTANTHDALVKVANCHTVKASQVHERTLRAAADSSPRQVKVASVLPSSVDALAQTYALYQVSAILHGGLDDPRELIACLALNR